MAFVADAHEVVGGSVDKSLMRWKAKSATTTAASTKSTPREPAKEANSPEPVNSSKVIVLKTDQPVLSLSFSKDHQRLAVGTGLFRTAGFVQLWDLAKRERIWQSDEFKFGVAGVTFLADQKRIAVGNFADNFLRLMDASSGKQLKEIRGHRGKIAGIACSPNGKYLATASLDRDIKLWDTTTNKEVKSFTGHTEYVYSISFSPDGQRLLSGSYDRTARVWDVEKGKELAQFKGHSGTIQQAVYSPDGARVATASADGTARLYDAASGDFLLTLRGHRNKLETLAFSTTGALIATGSVDRTIRLWDPTSGVELQSLPQDGIVRVVAFSLDGKYLVSGCDDKTVKLWELTPLRPAETTVSKTDRP